MLVYLEDLASCCVAWYRDRDYGWFFLSGQTPDTEQLCIVFINFWD